METVAARIREILEAYTIDDWGVADNAGFPLSPPLPTAISLVKRLRPESLTGLKEAPTDSYFGEFLRVNWLLSEAGQDLADLLVSEGHHVRFIPPIIEDPDAVVDWGAAGVFPHKTAATQAGLGWIGKTALFVHHEFGPRVRLATLFTTVSLPQGTPVTKSECGTCVACVRACPVNAGRDLSWEAGAPRSELFDEKACERYTDSFWPLLGGVCGVCVAACPVGVRRAP
jgi:NAD-dependent dihydropyrimidine dehydrogenase PreA subunit